MCLAVPAQIVAIDGEIATVESGGFSHEISLALVDQAVVGDYVLVHVGYALSKLDPEEARRTLAELAVAGEVWAE
ncbi:MAG: HypC/HybG/HupF family hydrogenase formation chaperone [Zoogloeaceae bacterium]|jgi:hydrogenase expression/formation protein HypC|nr:HypC/HybG/HupF family hydrogenase formation chaperone [Zoogloeaceae bacterium]